MKIITLEYLKKLQLKQNLNYWLKNFNHIFFMIDTKNFRSYFFTILLYNLPESKAFIYLNNQNYFEIPLSYYLRKSLTKEIKN